jgi:hypothetical protein
VQKDNFESLEQLVREHLGDSEFQRLCELEGGLPDLGRSMAVSIDGEHWSLIVPRSGSGSRKRKPWTGSVWVIPAEGEPTATTWAKLRTDPTWWLGWRSRLISDELIDMVEQDYLPDFDVPFSFAAAVWVGHARDDVFGEYTSSIEANGSELHFDIGAADLRMRPSRRKKP